MRPFRDGDTSATFRSLTESILKEIQSLDNEYVLKASPSELEQYYVDKALRQPLVFRREDLQIEDSQGVDVDVSRDIRRGLFLGGQSSTVRGTRITVSVPFEGDPTLWGLRASTYSVSGYPEITIGNGAVTFGIEFPDDDAKEDQIRERINRNVDSLANAVNYLRNDVNQHNNAAPDTIRQALERKRKLAESTTGVLSKLGIPIKRKEEAPAFALPVKRRESPVRPAVMTSKYEREPFLDEKEYEHILSVARGMSLVIERNPTSFSGLDEEAIRDHFLIQLNGHYEGGATGETFNSAGKTDILLRSGNRNVFIAECKFWKGTKAFDEAIDQLLSYLTWRDSKCGLLVFNRTQDSSGVREKMHAAVPVRPEHKKTVFSNADGDSRYILIKPSEPGREIIVTTQLYDVPAKARAAPKTIVRR